MRFKSICVLTIFVSLSAFGQKAYLASPTQNLSGDWVKAEGHAVEMPKSYSNESQDISFCYGFSAASLINQMLFLKNSQSYEPISMLDLSVNGLGMGVAEMLMGESMEPKPTFDDLGNFYRVLIYGKLKKQVAHESCMPFDRLNFLKSSNPKRSDSFQNFSLSLALPFSIDPTKIISKSSAADQILTLEPKLGLTKTEVEEILSNAKVQSFEDVLSLMAKMVVPKKCVNERVKIPEFNVAQIKVNSSNRSLISNYFIETLNRNRPLSWAFCINLNCDQQHVLLITGWRKICKDSSKECHLQFLLRDSGTQVFNSPGDFWVNEIEIHKKIDIMLGNYEMLKSKNILPDMIANLEY